MRTLVLCGLLLGAWAGRAAIPPVSTYDNEVQAWRVSALTNASGTVSDVAYQASTQFMLMLKRAGLRANVYRLNLFPGNAGSSLVPLIRDYGPTLDVVTVSAGGAVNFSEAVGAQVAATGTTECIDIGLTPSAGAPNGLNGNLDNVHFGVYHMGTAGAETAHLGGSYHDDGHTFQLAGSFTSVGAVASLWSATGRPVDATDTSGRGFYVGTRVGSGATDIKLYRNGALVASSSSSAGAISALQPTITVLMLHASGPAFFGKTLRPAGAYTVGSALNATQMAALYYFMQAYQVWLGRGV